MRAFVLPNSEKAYAKDGKKDYEHYARYVKMYDKYFGHLTGIVMVPRGSTLPLCLGGADFDGDLVSIILNQDVVDAVAKGVYQRIPSKSLYYYERKLPAIEIPATSAVNAAVPDYVEYEHIYNTFSNHIGRISNAAISIGQVEYDRKNTGESEYDADIPTCAKCTLLTGLEIDAAKNGVHPNLDLILNNDIPKSGYLSFLRGFKELKAEENFHLDRLEIKEENVLIKGSEKRVITLGAKNCQTKAEWYPENEETGTYINLLPKYFMEHYKAFIKIKSRKIKTDFRKPKSGKAEKNAIKEFKESCDGIFELYNFYKNILLKSLAKEKNKGYYAVENMEVLIMRMYDESQADEMLFQTLPELRQKLEDVISDESEIDCIKERINSLQWQFQPQSRRGMALEQIIGNGFKESDLTEKEKKLLYHFNQQGYKMLWRLLDLIQGPKIHTYSEVQGSAIEAAKCPPSSERFLELEGMLNNENKCFYESNASNTEQKLYAHCLNALRDEIRIYSRSVGEKEKLAYALYEMIKSKTSLAKFFWDAFSWEDIKFIINKEEADG